MDRYQARRGELALIYNSCRHSTTRYMPNPCGLPHAERCLGSTVQGAPCIRRTGLRVFSNVGTPLACGGLKDQHAYNVLIPQAHFLAAYVASYCDTHTCLASASHKPADISPALTLVPAHTRPQHNPNPITSTQTCAAHTRAHSQQASRRASASPPAPCPPAAAHRPGQGSQPSGQQCHRHSPRHPGPTAPRQTSPEGPRCYHPHCPQ